jgi:hypothetical protein
MGMTEKKAGPDLGPDRCGHKKPECLALWYAYCLYLYMQQSIDIPNTPPIVLFVHDIFGGGGGSGSAALRRVVRADKKAIIFSNFNDNSKYGSHN